MVTSSSCGISPSRSYPSVTIGQFHCRMHFASRVPRSSLMDTMAVFSVISCRIVRFASGVSVVTPVLLIIRRSSFVRLASAATLVMLLLLMLSVVSSGACCAMVSRSLSVKPQWSSTSVVRRGNFDSASRFVTRLSHTPRYCKFGKQAKSDRFISVVSASPRTSGVCESSRRHGFM